MRRPRKLPVALVAALALGQLAQAAQAARAPVGRHYMVLQVEHVSWPPTMLATRTCLSFKGGEICNEDDICGGFELNERWSGGNRWWAQIDKGDPEESFELVLLGHTETAGEKSSIGGTIIFSGDDLSNGSFAGVQAPRKRCLDFAASKPQPEPPGPGPGPVDCIPPSRCCKICSTGKACGDSCISRDKICRKSRGCACNRSEVCSGATGSDSFSWLTPPLSED